MRVVQAVSIIRNRPSLQYVREYYVVGGKQAVQQIKKKFTNGLYRSIFTIDCVGTFYSPINPTFHLSPYAYMLFFPATQVLAKLFCQRVCVKDQTRVCCWLIYFNL